MGIYVVAFQLSKNRGTSTAHSMSMHWHEAESEEAAIGMALRKLPEMKPGFSIDNWLVSGPLAEIAERNAIVAYLRECEAIHQSNLRDGKNKTASKHHADACHFAADAIERGEHLIKGEPDHG